jgi:signal transduction histidine kinase
VTQELFRLALEEGKVDAAVMRDSEVLHPGGRATPVSINVAAVRDYLNETVGCVCLFQDITRRKQVESLNQLKNDLTDMIVHDLRTPLTSLLTGLQSVPLLGEMNEDQAELVGLSIEGGQVLLSMINDLLDISKMEDGSIVLERKELAVTDVVDRALRQVENLSSEKSLQLVSDIAPTLPILRGDNDKLVRTLVNLLSNAIKFTPTGGCITLSVSEANRLNQHDEDGSAAAHLFSVRDTGEGIPEEAFGRIFEKFGQVESRKAGRKMSTGLGLTFCRMVAEAHGGHIWVESETGAGSTFRFTIPAS